MPTSECFFGRLCPGRRTGHPVLLRRPSARTRLAGAELQDGCAVPVVWKPSVDDRRIIPDCPADACVRGLFDGSQSIRSNGAEPFLWPLALGGGVRALPCSESEILDLYGHRGSGT